MRIFQVNFQVRFVSIQLRPRHFLFFNAVLFYRSVAFSFLLAAEIWLSLLPIFATIRKHGGLTAGVGFLHPVTDRVTLSAHGCVAHSWSRRVSAAPSTAQRNGINTENKRRNSFDSPEGAAVSPASLMSLRSASACSLLTGGGRKNATCHPPRHVAGFSTLPRVGKACRVECVPL